MTRSIRAGRAGQTMRLAAKISPMRAERRGAALRATLRETPDLPRDIEIVDLSNTGFLAELPEGVAITPGTSVRVAAAPIGSHVAFVVRNEGRRHGFAFQRPLARGMLDRIDSIDADTVVPFAAGQGAAFPVAHDITRPSARSSLAIMTGVSLLLWGTLASLLLATARFA